MSWIRKPCVALQLGDEEALTGSSVRTILERVKSDLVRDKDDAIKQEQNARKQVTDERDQLQKDNDQVTKNLYWVAENIARIIAVVVEVGLLSILIFAAIAMTIVTTPFILGNKALTTVVITLALVGVIWGLINWYLGITVRQFSRNIQKWLRARIYDLLCWVILRNRP